jgi:chorismate synthase
MNTFGNRYKITSFGESHGVALGVVIDGCPAGLKLDWEAIQVELDRRKPGQSRIASQRKESDTFEVLSGHIDGVTTGAPLTFIVRNQDARSQDYTEIAQAFRPSHADYTYFAKYGIRDARGGGRASARETLTRVIGGAVAKQILQKYCPEIAIHAWVSAIHTIVYSEKPQLTP